MLLHLKLILSPSTETLCVVSVETLVPNVSLHHANTGDVLPKTRSLPALSLLLASVSPLGPMLLAAQGGEAASKDQFLG